MINYPTSLDNSTTIPAESANTKLSTNHVTAHQNIQDAIEAIEAKVGVDGSAVTTSHDYKLSAITGSNKAVPNSGAVMSGATITTSTVNGVTLATGGSSTNFLSQDGTYQNGATTDASTTVKGVVEEATYAETIARTTAGGTSARLFVNPSTLPNVLSYDYQADAVGTDSYAITCTPAPTAYTTGMRFTFKAGTANTGTCTLNVNSLGAKTIKLGTSNLYTGQILANQVVEVVYDGTDMQLVSMSPLSTNATITEAVASSNTRTTNAASVGYNQSTTVYTKMKEILYNDVPGTVNVDFTTGWSGGGIWTNRTRVYINGVAAGTERNDVSGTYTEAFTLATGDLVQIYAFIPSYTSGSFTQSVYDMYLKYDKQIKQTFITNTNNS
jgi:hypothetical protein